MKGMKPVLRYCQRLALKDITEKHNLGCEEELLKMKKGQVVCHMLELR